MLIPKRTKYRKQFRGRMKGKEHRGNTVTYGEFGLVATCLLYTSPSPRDRG